MRSNPTKFNAIQTKLALSILLRVRIDIILIMLSWFSFVDDHDW